MCHECWGLGLVLVPRDPPLLACPRMHTCRIMDWRLRIRWLAIVCYYWAHRNITLAVRIFTAAATGCWTPANPIEFIRFWVQNLQSRFTLADAPRTGRRCKVPVELALECADVLKAGVRDGDDMHHHFHTLDEAINTDPIFMFTMIECDVNRETLLRAMHNADPDLTLRHQETKWMFTQEERLLRVYYADVMRKIDRDDPLFKYTIIFFDEASIYVSCQNGRLVWCSKHGDRPLHLTRHAGNKYKNKMKFYIGVNSLLGPLGPYFTTGTTGLGQQFTVRGQTPLAPNL